MLPGYLDIYWDIEEAMFIHLTEQLDAFYREFEGLVRQYLEHAGVTYDRHEVAEVIRYQRLRIPESSNGGHYTELFTLNVPEYFDHLFTTEPIALVADRQVLSVSPRDYRGDKEQFVRGTILWGRQSGTLTTRCSWRSLERAGASSDVLEARRAERAEVILANWPSTEVPEAAQVAAAP